MGNCAQKPATEPDEDTPPTPLGPLDRACLRRAPRSSPPVINIVDPPLFARAADAPAPERPPTAHPAAEDPETAKTIHSAIRWNKVKEVTAMITSKVRARRPSDANAPNQSSALAGRFSSALRRAPFFPRDDPIDRPRLTLRPPSRVIAPRSQELASVPDASNGNCPIHIAAQNGHLEILKVLVEKGADVNAQNGGGQTPLHMTVSYDIEECVAFLKSHGAKGDVKNKEGHRAEHGLSGEKDRSSAAGQMDALKCADSEKALKHALDELLKHAKKGHLDKAVFPGAGLKVKKAKAEMWTEEVQKKFVAVVQEIK
jgi:hypothetical protein